jgi:mannitol-1-phosphate 5-dehydrogenase
MRGKRYVGFGMGAIQAGLMLLEAQESGNFAAYCIAETNTELVHLLRAHDCRVTVNIAWKRGIRKRSIEGFTVENPFVQEDRCHLGRAIAEADELATAIPGVNFYSSGGSASVAALIAEFAGKNEPQKPQIIYACENHNFAAQLLKEEIGKQAPGPILESIYILNTVIGKMSGTINTREEIEKLGLAPMVPGADRAILVEEFNKILVSRLHLPGYNRGIDVFEEKDDLLSFGEAKLYGHNAIHSLLGYLAYLREYDTMSDIRNDSELLELGRSAFLIESGRPLIKKYGSTGDPLFTESGYREYAEDLIERMTNPYLHDKVERICRDPARKLGYNDRIFGTMRNALSAGVIPRIMALGAAAAIRYAGEMGREWAEQGRSIGDILRNIWRPDDLDEQANKCVCLVEEAEVRIEAGEWG